MSSRTQEIELVVFDMDGVLVDSSPCHAFAFAQLWASCGIPAIDYEKLAGRTTRDVVFERTAHLGPTDSQIDDWVAFKQDCTLECFEKRDIVYPDAIATLENLRARGFMIALGTGASRVRTNLILERLGATGWFQSVVTANDVTKGKPNPETYVAAIARAGSTPEKTIIVEDSESGVTSALAAGARVASVRTGVVANAPGFAGDYSDLNAFAAGLPNLVISSSSSRSSE